MLVCVGLCATNSPSYFPGKYEPGNPKKPLHQCNFYGSVEAGNKMKEMLSLGSSRPWREAMQKMTGQRKMSTKAIREYFAPLESWLKEENRKTGVTVGWGETDVDSMCQQTLGSTKERENSHWLKGEKQTNTAALRHISQVKTWPAGPSQSQEEPSWWSSNWSWLELSPAR